MACTLRILLCSLSTINGRLVGEMDDNSSPCTSVSVSSDSSSSTTTLSLLDRLQVLFLPSWAVNERKIHVMMSFFCPLHVINHNFTGINGNPTEHKREYN